MRKELACIAATGMLLGAAFAAAARSRTLRETLADLRDAVRSDPRPRGMGAWEVAGERRSYWTTQPHGYWPPYWVWAEGERTLKAPEAPTPVRTGPRPWRIDASDPDRAPSPR